MKRLLATTLFLSTLAGCGSEPVEEAEEPLLDVAEPAPYSAPATSSSGPTGVELPPTPTQYVTAEAAVSVLRDYCNAIARGDGESGGRFWEDEEASDEYLMSYDSYDCRFDRPREIEGPAGSALLEVPAVISGTRSGGGSFAREGEYLMRRVNDLPGSTRAERRWRILGSTLKEVRP